MNKPQTHLDLALLAKQTFDRNIDTLVAGYLIRHPHTDPADIELVFTPNAGDGVMRFSIEPKELHVPPVKAVPDPNFKGDVDETTYAAGWNDCRNAILAMAKSFRAPEAMVSNLGAANDI